MTAVYLRPDELKRTLDEISGDDVVEVGNVAFTISVNLDDFVDDLGVYLTAIVSRLNEEFVNFPSTCLKLYKNAQIVARQRIIDRIGDVKTKPLTPHETNAVDVVLLRLISALRVETDDNGVEYLTLE